MAKLEKEVKKAVSKGTKGGKGTEGGKKKDSAGPEKKVKNAAKRILK